MNRTIFWRLVWKEYRLQRAFWIAMTVLGVMGMFIAWKFNYQVDERIKWIWYFALGTPVFYALGSASITFAAEHDAGTFEFQRSMPVDASHVFWGKVFLVASSTLAMLVLLGIPALCLVGIRLSMEKPFTIWETRFWEVAVTAGTGVWLFIVWGVFFSLISKRPLLAAILAVTVASTGSSIADGIFQIYYVKPPVQPLWIFAGLSTLLALVDITLGRGWFREKVRPAFRLSLPVRLVRKKSASKSKTLVEYMSGPNFWTMLGRLTWQHWRQSKWIGLVVLIMLSPLLLGLLCVCVDGLLYYGVDKHYPELVIDKISYYFGFQVTNVIQILLSIGLPLAFAIPPLVGSSTFLADQRQNNFRFFTERGVSPRTIWLSRMWPWLIIVMPFLLIAILIDHLDISVSYPTWNEPIQFGPLYFVGSLLFLFGYPVLGLCVGQHFSMFFRSGLLAGLFSLIFTAIFGLWSGLMWIWDMSFLWSVAPIPVALLLATWLRAPDWVLERRSLHTWLLPTAVVVVPVLVILTAIPFLRVYAIPAFTLDYSTDGYTRGLSAEELAAHTEYLKAVDPGFSVEEFIRPLDAEESATRALFVKAHAQMDSTILEEIEAEKAKAIKEAEEAGEKDPVYTDSTIPQNLSDKEIAFVKANQKIITMLIEASKGSERIYWYNNGIEADFWWSDGMPELLIHNAMILQSEGKLDEALEQYLAALRISKQLRSFQYPYKSNNLEQAVYEQLPFWATHPDQTPERIKKAIAEIEKITTDMPADEEYVKWSYLRALEAIKYRSENVDKNASGWGYFLSHLPWERARALRLLNYYTHQALGEIAHAKSMASDGRQIYVDRGRSQYYSNRTFNIKSQLTEAYSRFMSIDYWVREFAAMVNERRAVRVLLALQAWKLEHGNYPKTLDELAGTYFERVPTDPYTGEAYQYFPEGVKTWIPNPGMNFGLLSPKDRPFIWSASPGIRTWRRNSSFLSRFQVYDWHRVSYQYYWRQPTSLYDLLSHGRNFFLP